MEFQPKEIMNITGLNRQVLAELDKLNIISPNSYRNKKKYKLYDEKQLDDLCIIGILIKCNKTPRDIKKLINENKTKSLYDILEIVRQEAEDISKVITNIQFVGPSMLTKSFCSMGMVSLHDIAERYRKYERSLEEGIQHIDSQKSKRDDYLAEVFEKEFKRVILYFVKAKKTNNKNDLKIALKEIYGFFKVISNNHPIQYLLSESKALQGEGFESEYVNYLAGVNIANYISDEILNHYIPKLNKEILDCFKNVNINKDKYNSKKVQVAISKMITCIDKYILFDDFTQNGNQLLNILKVSNLKEQNITEFVGYIIKALDYYSNHKKEK